MHANQAFDTKGPKPTKITHARWTNVTTDDASESQPLIQQTQQTQQQMQQQTIEFSSQLIAEREEGIKQIESTMLEVNEIYKDLAVIVDDQGQQLDNIEANMTSADTHVERGVAHLNQASRHQVIYS